MATKVFLRAAAAVIVAGSVFATNPAAAVTFPRAVEQILMAQTDGPLAKLDDSRKREMVACVNGVLAGLPKGKQRFVTEAASFDELEDRFGKVVMENRAEWKQKIAKNCAHIVTRAS
jgi:hypothetical protein